MISIVSSFLSASGKDGGLYLKFVREPLLFENDP